MVQLEGTLKQCQEILNIGKMKKYKLVKPYPNSLEVGTEVIWGDHGLTGECYQAKVKAGIFRFSKDTVENNPEFWQEVIEEDYEILSMLLYYNMGRPCNTVVNTCSQFMLNTPNSYKIHSVKRLSDGLIVKIGDYVVTKNTYTAELVTGFRINDGTTSFKKGIWVTIKTGGMHLDRIKEIRKPILVTEDGVPVYSYDTTQHWVINGNYEYALGLCRPNVELVERSPNTYKLFSTEIAAREYVRKNTPLFTTEDGVRIFKGDTYWCVNTAPHLWSVFEQTANERTQLNKTVKAFTTEVAAREYVRKNKPLFITEDGVKIFEGGDYHYVDTDFSITKMKALYGCGQYTERKYFFTFTEAQKYVNRTQPRLSIEDCLNIREEWHSNRLGLEESIREYLKKHNK